MFLDVFTVVHCISHSSHLKTGAALSGCEGLGYLVVPGVVVDQHLPDIPGVHPCYEVAMISVLMDSSC